MLGAVLFAHEASKKVVNAIIDLAEKDAKDPWDVAKGDNLDDLKKKLKKLIGKDIEAAYKLPDTSARSSAIKDGRRKSKAFFAARGLAHQPGQTEREGFRDRLYADGHN